MSPETLQGWVAVVGGLATAILGLLKHFSHQSKRERLAGVGASFVLTVDALGSDKPTSQMAGAVLLRRFFDSSTEQGDRDKAYVKEAVALMAGMLREKHPETVRKVLADGLRYAQDLTDQDLQNCDLTNAYLGKKNGDKWAVDLSRADLYNAECGRASFRGVVAVETVFVEAKLQHAVFTGADCREADFRRAELADAKFQSHQKLKLNGADCREADFRGAKLRGANFEGAKIGRAKFDGCEGIPDQVIALLDEQMQGLPDGVVPEESPQ